MSGNNWDIDVDHEDYEDAPRALRDAYKNLKKQFQTVTTERDDYKGKWQSKTANDALSGFGFRNPKRVSKDLLADGVDLSDTDAVKAWVEENGDDYARGEAPAAPAGQNVDAEEVAARQQLSAAQSYSQPAPNDKLKAAFAEITPDMDGEAVKRIYEKFGI